MCLIVDFHYGQALGVLRHLMGLLGVEEGTKMYKKLMGGCMSHLGKSGGQAINQSAADWGGEELDDFGLTMKTEKGNLACYVHVMC